MSYLTIGIISISLVAILLLWMAMRFYYHRESTTIDKHIEDLPRFQSKDSYDKAKETTEKQNQEQIDNLKTLLESSFVDHVITAAEKESFSELYRPLFKKVYAFTKKLAIFHLEPSESITQFVEDYCSLSQLVNNHNQQVINSRLILYQDFFDHCLQYPLDNQQRRSILSEENNCLVVSSAGSGKTSSIVGKVKYLIDIKKIPVEQILLISYTNKAATELTERVNVSGLRGYTFHKLALDIISRVTGQKPTICDNTDLLLVNIYHLLLKNKGFKKSIIDYFAEYQDLESDREKQQNEKRRELIRQKKERLKAILPDMDGNAVYVKSKQEQKICFALSSLGLNYRYEDPYEFTVADEMHSQYKPDFSIYYEKNGKRCRIYLEHFGIDEHGLVPSWFAKEKGISYDEANKKYGDGITWKKEVHERYGTTMISTSSADFRYHNIRDFLKKQFIQNGVPVHEKTDDEICELILPENSPQEKAFIRLIITFITLMKSRCVSINDVLKKAHYDEHSTFTIKNIIKPVYDAYALELQKRKELDFTDIILQATELCKSSHPVDYRYIIVDEFQDISIDRYNFLLALRDGNPPAKLYCVGDDWQSIYRFSGSDMALFNRFADYFGPTEINRIETTYRFGNPLIELSSKFIQRNETQISKNIHTYNNSIRTELQFYSYYTNNYCNILAQLISSIPKDKSIFLLGRYSFDDIHLASTYQSVSEGDKTFYIINDRKIEFLTVHKSKGLEADYVILLQCNKGTYGFPSQISDNPVLDHVLTKSDQFPYGEERRLFYVAITRAKVKTMVLYDQRIPSLFVDEFLLPETINRDSYSIHPNAMKKWTRAADRFLITLYKEGKSIREISEKMGRSQTAIVMRLGKLGIS